MTINLDTKNEITWCPGCPNFMIKEAVKRAILRLIEQGYKQEDFVMVTDIGCNAKMFDYLNISGFYGLHGRVLPVCLGISIANPHMKIIGFGGDGGTYNEGISHFAHNCRYNANFTMLVHNNQIFSLTTGQATATTETGFIEKTHPFGIKEKPLNPIVMALELGATFVARANALDINHTSKIIEEAIKHKGFSFIDILQPCLVYHNYTKWLRDNNYKIEPMAYNKALEESKKWNYEHKGKVAIGIFYKEKKPTLNERYFNKQ